MSSIEERLNDLERRLKHFEDIEAIRNIKHQYCRFTDLSGTSWSMENMADLFTEDGIWEAEFAKPGIFDGTIRFVGRKAIADGIREMSQGMDGGIHYLFNPKIEIDGDTAKGAFYGLMPNTLDNRTEPLWFGGIYFEDYVRTPQGWRIKHLRVVNMLVPQAG